MEVPDYNLWYLPCKKYNYDLEEMVKKYKEDSNLSNLDDMYLFISFPTGKTKEKNGKTTCIVLAEGTYE